MAVNEVAFGKSKYHLQGEMSAWCTKHIGENPPYSNWVMCEPTDWDNLGLWCMASMFGQTFFYFREEKDMTAFLLRWS